MSDRYYITARFSIRRGSSSPFYLIRDNATPHYTASETLFRSALNKLQRGRHLYLPSRQKKLID